MVYQISGKTYRISDPETNGKDWNNLTQEDRIGFNYRIKIFRVKMLKLKYFKT